MIRAIYRKREGPSIPVGLQDLEILRRLSRNTHSLYPLPVVNLKRS